MNAHVPTSPDAKRMLTEGKVVIAGLGGDKAVLRAMQSNEKTTNEKYEEALKENELDAAMRDTLRANYEDEQGHKAWIDSRIGQL